jgi:uncharacterized membrane protein
MTQQKPGPVTFVVAFLKATIIGGFAILLPLVVVLIILGHAMNLAVKVVNPAIKLLPDALVGAGLYTVVAVLVLLILALSAGMFARSRPGMRVAKWFENSMLAGVPQYQFAKSMADGFAQIESDRSVSPALVSIEGGWQLGYVLETLDSGWVSVFLPQAPTPMSGSIMYFPASRVRPLDISMVQAMGVVKRLGVGSAEALKGADLTLPEGA